MKCRLGWFVVLEYSCGIVGLRIECGLEICCLGIKGFFCPPMLCYTIRGLLLA